MATAAVKIGVKERIFKATNTHIMNPKTIIAEVIVANNNFQGFQIILSSQVN